MWGKFHKLTKYTHSLSVTKNDLSWLTNLFMVRFQLIRCPLHAKNKLQMCSVTQHQCRRRQMCGKLFTNSPCTLTFYLLQKWLLLTEQSILMVRFQLIGMSSYAKNKLQMCSVNQHQCRFRQMWGNVSQIHPVHSHFICYIKWLVLTEQSIHGKVSTLFGMSSYAKNKLKMCSVTQHQWRRRQMWGKFSQIHPVL